MPPARRPAINHSSLSQQAAEEVRQRIASRTLLPGQRLDEARLADELGISRTPLREALKVLATEGLIDLRPRRGCYVAELSKADLEGIFPIMALLEGEVAREASQRASTADLAKLDALHTKLEKFASAGDIDRYYDTNYEFHSTLQTIAGNPWLLHVIGDLRKLLRLSRHRSLKLEGRLGSSLAEHRELMTALHGRDAEAAERIMKTHLLAQLDALRQMPEGEA